MGCDNCRCTLHGHFRLENSQMPPAKVKLKKSDTKGTSLNEQKLKLVVPRQRTRKKDIAAFVVMKPPSKNASAILYQASGITLHYADTCAIFFH